MLRAVQATNSAPTCPNALSRADVAAGASKAVAGTDARRTRVATTRPLLSTNLAAKLDLCRQVRSYVELADIDDQLKVPSRTFQRPAHAGKQGGIFERAKSFICTTLGSKSLHWPSDSAA